MKVSVIIPTYNEEQVIENCIKSLIGQTSKDIEIIIVDDGSTDDTLEKISHLKDLISRLQVLKQKHEGPGIARNLGARHAKGEVLVFVDADMTFDKNFIKKLAEPIIKGIAIGTFSKQEFVENASNVWSRCWNINKGLPQDRMHAKDYPDTQPVFRSILKKEFDKVGGFSPLGYIDDYTLSEKLGKQAMIAEGAIFYHSNPATLLEVFNQARWIGKSEFKRRKISSEFLMRLASLVRYCLPFTIINGLKNSLKYQIPQFLIFKLIYDLAIEISLLGSFVGEQKYK